MVERGRGKRNKMMEREVEEEEREREGGERLKGRRGRRER